MAVYTISLAKGGTTKTTTAAEVVARLAARGRRVLAIDLDQQGNFTTRLGVTRDHEVHADAAQVLSGDADADVAAIVSPTVEGAHVIAGTHALADVEALPETATSLRDYLPRITGSDQAWDDVVIDTPPALGILTLAALAAADVVIAPVACEAEAYEQLDRLERFIADRVAKRLRPGQQVHWIIPTRCDPRRRLDQEVVAMLTDQYGQRVTSPIREGIVAKDSYVAGQPVSVYDPTGGVATDYAAALGPVIA